MTDSLQKDVEELAPKWLGLIKAGWKTEPADRPRAEEIIRKLYTLTPEFDGPVPEIVWADSPYAAIKYMVDRYGESEGETALTIIANVSILGNQHGCWASPSLLPDDEVYEGVYADFFQAAQELTHYCGWVWLYQEICVVSERHSTVKLDDHKPQRLHCEDGPALTFPDETAIYAIHGVQVPQQVVMSPQTLTVQQIQEETNVDVQRIMLERKLGGLPNVTEEPSV